MLSREADDPKSGMTLQELEDFVQISRMNGLSGDASVRADVGMRGQVKVLRIR